MTITLCCYRGQDAAALGSRLVQRRRGQLLADVPAHVAVVVEVDGQAMLYEAVLSGIRARPAVAADYAWSRVVDVPHPELALAFYESQLGHRYRIESIVLVVMRLQLGLLGMDKQIGLVDNCRTAWICSTLVAEGLRLGGFDLEDALRQSGNDFTTPIRPNDLWFMSRGWPVGLVPTGVSA